MFLVSTVWQEIALPIDQPAIAVNAADEVLAVWTTTGGEMVYSAWLAGQNPPAAPIDCIPVQVGTLAELSLAGGENSFALAYAGRGWRLFAGIRGSDLADNANTHRIAGAKPDVWIGQDGSVHVAWCGEEGRVQYQRLGDDTETIDFPGCKGQPVLAEDVEGQPHLVWYADETQNVFGIENASQLVYESTRTEDGWSQPAIVATTALPTQPALATQADGTLHLAWPDLAKNATQLFYARQEPFSCDENSLSPLEQAILNTMETGGFHPEGYETPFCRNEYVSLVYMPNPTPGEGEIPPTINGGFDKVSEAIQDCRIMKCYSRR